MKRFFPLVLACLLATRVLPLAVAQSDGGGGGGGDFGGGDSGYYPSGDDGNSDGQQGSCDSDCSRNAGIVIGSIVGGLLFCVCCGCALDQVYKRYNRRSEAARAAEQVELTTIVVEGQPDVVPNQRFPCGRRRATGTYTGHAASAWNRGSHATSIDTILFAGGRIVGGGCDKVGSFTIQGTYVDASGRFEWTKSYTGTQNQVIYQGDALGEIGDRLQGTWRLAHKNDHGTFDLSLATNPV
jgi:hypothetical protein